MVVGIGALVVAVLLARRGQQAGALYLGILGLLDLKGRLSADGRPLEILTAAGPGNRDGRLVGAAVRRARPLLAGPP